MYVFIVSVSIRKGLGPEWFQKSFTVTYDDVDLDLPVEELKEWAREDVRGQLRSSYDGNGENWIIEDVQLQRNP